MVTAPYDALNWLTDQLFIFMNALYERYGVPIVFVAGVAEATVGVGVVFPGVLLMFLAGAYTADPTGVLGLVFLSAVAGPMLGDTISYGLGRWGRGFDAKRLPGRSGLVAEHLVDGLLRGETTARFGAYQTAIASGWMSRNEARSLENLNPVEGLDEFLVPSGSAVASGEEQA